MCACVCVVCVPVDLVDAGSLVEAGAALTLVRVHLAVMSLEPRHTVAGVAAHMVPAGGAIEARPHLTLIHLLLTVHP